MTSYPAQLREALTVSKLQGIEFEVAWRMAAVAVPRPDEWKDLGSFLKQHMRDAYTNAQTRFGRLVLDPRDTHEGERRPVSDLPAVAYCRSGDGCDRIATTGRDGRRTWCEFHGAELERIAEKLQLRPKFNNFIFGLAGKRARAAA